MYSFRHIAGNFLQRFKTPYLHKLVVLSFSLHLFLVPKMHLNVSVSQFIGFSQFEISHQGARSDVCYRDSLNKNSPFAVFQRFPTADSHACLHSLPFDRPNSPFVIFGAEIPMQIHQLFQTII